MQAVMLGWGDRAIRPRTEKTRSCVSVKTLSNLLHQVGMSAQELCDASEGFGQFAGVVAKVKFADAMEERKSATMLSD